jgi:hypothetical protein
MLTAISGDFPAATSVPPNYVGGRSHGELRLLPQPRKATL